MASLPPGSTSLAPARPAILSPGRRHAMTSHSQQASAHVAVAVSSESHLISKPCEHERVSLVPTATLPSWAPTRLRSERCFGMRQPVAGHHRAKTLGVDPRQLLCIAPAVGQGTRPQVVMARQLRDLHLNFECEAKWVSCSDIFPVPARTPHGIPPHRALAAGCRGLPRVMLAADPL